jgi:type I restriction enzyme S subunit
MKTKAMKDHDTTGLVPKLRFPEFRGAEGWTNKQLGELFSDRQEAGHSGLPLLSLMDKEGIVPQEDSNRKNNSNSDKSKYLRVVPGDIAYNTMRMCEGRSALVGLEGLVSPAYTVCKPQPGVHSLLFSYYFKTPQLIEQFRRFSQGLVKDTLNLKYPAFAQISAPAPTYLEQQKIADCLGSLDELIAAQRRKVEALKTHKKGLMQKLFPREGETQPRLRFPEFQSAGDWEEQSVEDFGKVVTGSTPSTAQPAFYGGGIPFVSPADISDMRFVEQTKTTLTADGFAETRHIRAGSTLFVCIGSTIGKAAQNIRDCATNQQINAVVPSPKHSDGFVYFSLSFASERIALLAGKQAVPIINKSLFSSVRLLAPKLAEQQRIADCLSGLDALISAASQELDTLKTHKQGLMQQIFPSVEDEQ